MAKVLIVDDQREIWEDWLALLQESGHQTIFAEDGKRGLEALAQNPDIIFLDFSMPVMNGYSFSREVRTNPVYSVYSSLPIIGVGSFPDNMKEYLTESVIKHKFGLEEQLACIRRYCEN